MKLSCTNSMVPGKTLTEKAQLLYSCGYDAISVFENIDEWNSEKENELFSLEERTGIKVCEFCFSGKDYGKLMHDDRSISEKSKDIYKRAIDICNRLGAVSEMEYLYQAQSPLPMLHPYRKMSPEDEQRFIAVFTELASYADGNAWLLLEPINRYESPYLNCVKDNLDILNKAALPHTGLLADIFHMSIEEKNICRSLHEAGASIKHVHLGDNNRLTPGNGQLNWSQIFRELNFLGYSGYVNLECAFASNDPITELKNVALFVKAHFLLKSN